MQLPSWDLATLLICRETFTTHPSASQLKFPHHPMEKRMNPKEGYKKRARKMEHNEKIEGSVYTDRKLC